MADDQSQRPYRSNVPPARGASGPAAPSGNDPLAELARLIGQNDPFSEFGRAGTPRQPEPGPTQDAALPLAAYPPQTQEEAAPPFADQQQFGAADFGRQPYGGDLYQVDDETSGYGAPGGYPPETGVPGYPPAPGEGVYEHEPFPAGQGPFPGQLGLDDDEYYDDVPPNRRRLGIIAIAGVFALAVLGTAGAFGYRAIFGSSSPASPPPVIMAETAPSKIVPATAGNDAQANKMITDRVNDRAQGEKLVSREEQPMDVNAGKPANIVFPTSQNAPSSGVAPSGSMASAATPQLGSGIIGTEPKRVRTIAIRPDRPAGTAAAPEAAPASVPEPAPAPAVTPSPPRVVNITPARAATPPRAAAPVQRPAITRAAPQPSANAPLSLNPNASPAPQQAPAPQRSAAVAPPTRLAPQATTSASGGYAVQVSSRRSEADAQAAFQTLQAKYPNQLGGQQPLIKRVDLGAKGIYFRAMVGPFASSGEASSVCSSLKAAGGDCIVQRN